MSNRLTFSLASLIVLLAFGLVFVATPAMAHVVAGDDTHSPDNSAGTAHSLASTLTVDTAYLTATNTITATVTFAPMVAAVADDNDAATLNVPAHATNDPANFDAVADFTVMTKAADGTFSDASNNPINVLRVTQTTPASTGVGSVYTVLISLATAHQATDDGEYYLGIDDTHTYNVDDETKNVNVKITVDSVLPTFPTGTTAGSIAPKLGETLPVNNQLTGAFNVLVDLMDTNLDGTSITFSAAPDELTFGTVSWSGGTRYTAEATPKAVTADETTPTSVVISVTVKDKAGNSNKLTVATVMLAPRMAPGDGTDGTMVDPPTATITVVKDSHKAAEAGSDFNVFRVQVVFTPATGGSAVTGFDRTKLTIKDSSTPTARDVTVRKASDLTLDPNPYAEPLVSTNRYDGILEYDTRESYTLPLKVTINQAMQETHNPMESADVGEAEEEVIETVVKPKATFSGMLSLTEQSIITVTFDKPVTGLATTDFTVTGGEPIAVNAKTVTAPTVANTVWEVAIDPDNNPFTESITVTIAATSTLAEPAATKGSLTDQVADGTLSSIVAATGADDTAAFAVTLTFAAALPAGADVIAADLKLTPTTATVTGIASLDRITWQVQIKPTTGMDTKIELSDAGNLKYDYAGAAVTVSKKTTVTAGGTVTAAYDATKKETAISVGVIAGNGFAVIDHTDLPDLELFFDIGGSITLHDNDTADDENSRTVVMSEILWGLDFGEVVLANQTKHQFIELYNTTDEAIDLKGWKLVFTEGNVRPTIDIDQVSNRGPGGWEVDTGETGKSGRVAETLADDPESTITPINIISMYRNINYTHVETQAAKDTVDRAELVKGIPGGNAIGSWKNSIRRSTNRWIYSTLGAKHHTTIGILSASSVAGTPFIINEIGNDTGGDNDWVEIHNLDDAKKSLKNYSLSMVTAKGTDTRLFHFHDQNWEVPGKGFIVISTRHPRDTDLATGKDINVPDDEELNKGLKHLYAVKSGWNLQDDGKFALILRNHHEKQGTAEHLIDVVATRQGSFADTNTSLWPLKVTGQPHENVIDAGDENFAAGKVYKRNGVNNGRGDKSFAVAGYTGIGYDVKASKISANHGTPGYANGAAQATLAGIGDDMVTISEIMFDVGDAALRRKLPQWIELHNASDTMGVDLNGWKLHIENAAQENGDLETNTFSATVTIGAKYILPNQTIIVASSTGNVRDPNHFPSTRVINLWTNKSHRDALEMARSTDPVLSTRGFSIQLVDKDGAEIDMVGNLDGNRRTRDEPAWPLPAYDTDDRSRSSILRVYEEKVALDGTMADSWKLASDTILAFEVSHAYYGSADDIGSPGYRTGGPLPVSLSKFRPERLDDGTIAIRWITESELNNAGFNILRSEKRDGEFKQINTKLIAGQGTTSERTTYTFPDTSAKPNVVYYYQIQDVSLDGQVTTLRETRLKGHISAAGKLTTTWGELKALQ